MAASSPVMRKVAVPSRVRGVSAVVPPQHVGEIAAVRREGEVVAAQGAFRAQRRVVEAAGSGRAGA